MRRLLQQISPTINVKQLDTDFSVSESLAASATARQSTNCNSNCVSCNDTVSAEKLSGISKSLYTVLYLLCVTHVMRKWLKILMRFVQAVSFPDMGT